VEKIFVDTNILLDVLLERRPFCEPAQELWTLAEQKKVIAAVSVLSFNNIFFILRKYSSASKAYQALEGISKIFKILELSPQMIHQAITEKNPDFEDALQYQAALKYKAKVIITRDSSGFKESKIKVMDAFQFLSSV